MYFVLYPILYLFSLLPFAVLYGFSNGVYVLMYHVFGYRKEVVMSNLDIAFPEKTAAEKKLIAKQFYKNFVDTLVETIKMISLSEKAFDKRVTADVSKSNELAARGFNIQFVSGHQMNWEYVNWAFAKRLKLPFVGIYQKVGDGAVNKIFYDIRARFGTVLVGNREFKTRMHSLLRKQYSLALAGDQNTSPAVGNWLYFFSKPTPFVVGPDKGALKNNPAIVFVSFIKIKRGHYHFQEKVMMENTVGLKPGDLTLLYRDFLEETIRTHPDNYLWSHRRWRHAFEEQYKKNWIDIKPAPEPVH